MRGLRSKRYPVVAVMVMLGFSFLLFFILIYRVASADADLARIRLAGKQASLAGEAGVFYAQTLLQDYLSRPGGAESVKHVDEKVLLPGRLQRAGWQKLGIFQDPRFRVNEIKFILSIDNVDTVFKREDNQFFVESEGRFQSQVRKTLGVLQVTNIAQTYCVFNSLDEYYYGQPLQPWASISGNIDNFIRQNQTIFSEKKISPHGICYDPVTLCNIYKLGGKDLFEPLKGESKFRGNYGTMFYSRGGESVCFGPLYCSSPIIVDSHTFWGPVQTAGFFYRRENAQPKIQLESSTVPFVSSKRVQLALEGLEGEVPDICADQDAYFRAPFVTPWHPDFTTLREYAKTTGIYVDSEGIGWIRGEKSNIDYHPEEKNLSSESYTSPVAAGYKRDIFKEKCITLSSKRKFAEQNNLAEDFLGGARIIFSENSISLRGKIGGDLVVVTPRHIYLTGSLNDDESSHHLFLIGGEGVGVATHDLQDYFESQRPSKEQIEDARNWFVKAVIYKPGAGWFSKWDEAQAAQDFVASEEKFPGQKINLRIFGACLEGNLNRWIRQTSPSGFRIDWDPSASARLPVIPRTVSVIRLKDLNGA